MNFLKLSILQRAFLAIIICFACSSGKLNAKEGLSFYLSHSSQVNPDSLSILQSALNKANLSFIQVKNTDFWHPYSQGLRNGKSGIYFAAPHLSAWAVNKHKFVPILKLAGNLQYVLVSRRNDIDIFEIRDLARKRICTSKAPNLDFILASRALSSSLNSPIIVAKKSAAAAMIANDEDCDAFAVSEHTYIKFSRKEPYKFIRLQQGKKHQNYAFIGSPNIDGDTLNRLKKVLLSTEISTLLAPLYSHYSLKPRLVRAQNKDFINIPNEYLNKAWSN